MGYLLMIRSSFSTLHLIGSYFSLAFSSVLDEGEGYEFIHISLALRVEGLSNS